MKYIKLDRFIVKISENNLTSINLFKSLGFKQISYSNYFREITLELIAQKTDLNVEIDQYRKYNFKFK